MWLYWLTIVYHIKYKLPSLEPRVLIFLSSNLHSLLQLFDPSAAAKFNYPSSPKHSLYLPASSSLPQIGDPSPFHLNLQTRTHVSFLSWNYSWSPHLSRFSLISKSLWYIITFWYKQAARMNDVLGKDQITQGLICSFLQSHALPSLSPAQLTCTSLSTGLCKLRPPGTVPEPDPASSESTQRLE